MGAFLISTLTVLPQWLFCLCVFSIIVMNPPLCDRWLLATMTGTTPPQFSAVPHRPYSKLVRTRYKVTNTVWLFYPNSSDFLLLMSLLCLHWCRCFTCLRLSLKHANHPRKVTYVNFTRRLKAAIITYKQASHIILILLRFRGLGVWRNIRGKWSYNIWV